MPTPAQHAVAQTVVTYRQGYDRAELLIQLAESAPPADRQARLRQAIRDLAIEIAELQIKHPRKPYQELGYQCGFYGDKPRDCD